MKRDALKKTALLIIAPITIATAICIIVFSYHDNHEEENKTYPYEWAWMQRTFPYFDADPSAHFDAIKEARQLKSETKSKYLRMGMNQVSWEFAGPTNIGGRVVDIEFNPRNPDTVYAAGATGGVLKSTNMGQSWFPIFDDQASLTIGDIAVDPLNPDIIYVGTGEANGGHNNFPGAGVFKSTDAGLTWKHIGLENTASIGRIIIDPINTQRIFVAAVGSYFTPTPDRGLYFNPGGGDSMWVKSWFVSDSTGAIDVIMDPTDPDFMMVAMWERVRRTTSNHLYGPTSGIYRSFDGGVEWDKLGNGNGLPDAAFQQIGRIGLALCMSQPNIIYALYNDGFNYTGLYKSTDYGANWQQTDPYFQIQSGTAYPSGFSWFFGQLRVHPNDPNTVYVLDVSFMRSTNGGEEWPVKYGYGGEYSDILHVDHHALAFNPENPDYIIEGNDGGINFSTDGGFSWSSRAAIPLTQFYEIGLDFQNPLRLYGGSQDNNTIRTTTGNLNDWASIIGGDGFYVLIDPDDPTIIYAESQNGDLRKLKETSPGNFNIGWALNGVDPNNEEPVNWSMPVVMDPNNSSILYLGTNKIYRTINKADSWESISEDLTNGPYSTSFGTVSTIAVAPSDSNVIYAGTDDSNIWVTSDFGANWRQINDETLPTRWVTRLVVDPYDENIVYATFSGLKWKDPQSHVFRSTDMGENWTDISSNLPDAPVNAFAVDFNNTNVLYLGNDVGAYISRDAGMNWEVLGEGIPIIPIGDMKIHPVENYLAVGTYGRSMYKIDLDEVTGIGNNETKTLPKDFTLYQNYPNPFNPATVIKFDLHKQSKVTLKVYDTLGREIKTLADETLPAGIHKINFDAGNLSSGVYFYRLETDNISETHKMIVLR